jgi:D-3-phosphoglycerate dehydrogenase / 2-oxoglutarate reductase
LHSEQVLMTDNIFASLDEFHARLEPVGLELRVAPASDEAALAELATSARALIVVYAKVTERIISAASQAGCRVISRCGIGYDNIDIGAATRHRIQVTNVPDYCIGEVADHTVALLLAFARNIVPNAQVIRNGGWDMPEGVIHRLQGRRLALIGVGRIGREVARRAIALGLDVTAYDPYVREWDLDGVGRSATLQEALEDANFISLHAPLTHENQHLIREETIALMKGQPVLINTARGGLIDLVAVTAAVMSGALSGVALDVFEAEPLPPNHPLRAHPRALLTPHMAYLSEEAEVELKSRAADEVVRAMLGHPPRCPVNRVEPSQVG